MAHLPPGTLVSVTGGSDIKNPPAVNARLHVARVKRSDMVPVHGRCIGIGRIKKRCVERNGVDQVVRKADRDSHGRRWRNIPSQRSAAAWTLTARPASEAGLA